MTSNNVTIKIGTDVDQKELDALKKTMEDLTGKKVNLEVGAETAIDKLREVQKKAKEIAAEKTLVNIDVATKGLKEIEEMRSTLENLKNISGRGFNVNIGEAEAKIEAIRKKIDDLDGLSPQIKTMIDSGAIDELQAIQTATDNLDGLSPVIKPTVDDSEAIAGLDNIQQSADNLGSAIGGVIAGIGIEQALSGGIQTAINMDKAWRSWVGSLQHSGLALDEAKKKANGLYKTVNRLSSEGQSNDTFFKNIANVLISSNNNISDSTLDMTEKVVAGYELMRSKSGDTLFEMEREIQQYLSTGDTARLTELQSIGGGKWMPLLEAATTAEERIKVLHDLLEEEGIMGALNIDAPSKSIDQIKAIFDAGMTDIGNTLINAVKPLIDFFMFLDDQTGGVSTMALIITGLGLAFTVLAISAFGAFSSLVLSAAGMLGVATAGVPLTGILWGIVSALWGMVAAVLANPLTWIIIGIAAAIILIVVAIQELGKYMGWWTDWGTMIESFTAGIKRLWAAFINNKHVQAVIQWLKDAWQGLMDFLKPTFDAINQWWSSMFPPQDGSFDIVRSIIDIFGLLGDGISVVVGTIIIPYLQLLWTVWSTIFGFIGAIITGVVIPYLQVLWTFWTTVFNAIVSILQWYWSAYSTIFNAVVAFIGKVVAAFNNFKNKVMAVVTTVIGYWNQFKQGVSTAVNAVKGFIDSLVSKFLDLKNKVMGYLQPIVDTLNTILGKQSQVEGGSGGSPFEESYYNGSAAGSPFEEASSNGESWYPTNEGDIIVNFNGLITPRDTANYIINTVEDYKAREATRS